MNEIDHEFDVKEKWIFDAWKKNQISHEEFVAEMDALGRWYIKEIESMDRAARGVNGEEMS